MEKQIQYLKIEMVYRLARYALQYAMEHQTLTFGIKTAVMWHLRSFENRWLQQIIKDIRKFKNECKKNNVEILDPIAWMALDTEASCIIRDRGAENKEVKK